MEKNKFKIKKFPRTRVATNDICEISQSRHHIAALLELDVTEARKKIKDLRKQGIKFSFTAWMVKVISNTIKQYDDVASFLFGKTGLILFDDVNISFLVEKKIDGSRIPIPLVLEKTNEISIESINNQIKEAVSSVISNDDIVLQRKSGKLERLYSYLPGFIRRYFWRFLLKHPKTAFSQMGNVAISSVGMMGNVDGWFIPKSIHPICFGLGSVLKKPKVIDDAIVIREIQNISVLMDHDVIDGADMARFIRDLSKNVANADLL